MQNGMGSCHILQFTRHPMQLINPFKVNTCIEITISQYLQVFFSFLLFFPPIQLHADSEPAQVIQDQM